jgi:competence protein ComEC
LAFDLARSSRPTWFRRIVRTIFVAICLSPLGCADQETTDDPPVPVLTATFIDVGQGDATLFELPGGETILIDGGDNGYGLSKIQPILAAKSIAVIDLLVLSHPHADHAGGLDEVLEFFTVLEIWENGDRIDTATYGDFALAREAEGVPAVVPDQGTVRTYADVKITAMNREEGYPTPNNNSLVLKISYGDTDFLMTGDVEKEENIDLIEDWGHALECEILKVPHHGSRDFDEAFAEWVSPQLAVISAGRENRYGHPSEEAVRAYLDADATVCRTDTSGDITVSTDGVTIEIECLNPITPENLDAGPR